VSYETTSEGKRQAAALRDFEKRSGRERKHIVAELPVGHDQYRRYLRGTTPLPAEYVPWFAKAWRVPRLEITTALGLDGKVLDALGLAPPDDPNWDFRAEHQRADPDHPERADRAYEDHKDKPQSMQRVMVELLASLHGMDNPSTRRAIAEERAEYAHRATGT
jgi:hypothetical protein